MKTMSSGLISCKKYVANLFKRPRQHEDTPVGPPNTPASAVETSPVKSTEKKAGWFSKKKSAKNDGEEKKTVPVDSV